MGSDATPKMVKGIEKRGTKCRAMVCLGLRPARQCGTCKRWTWKEQAPDATRCLCGGALGPEVNKRLNPQKSFTSQRAAERWRVLEMDKAEKGLPYFNERKDPGEPAEVFLQRYLSARAAEAPAPSGTRPTPATLQRYRQLIETYAVPVLQGRQVPDLTTDDVQAVIDGMSHAGQSPRSQLACRNLLHHAFKRGRIRPNPADDVNLPRMVDVKPYRAPTLVEVRTLLDLARGTEWELPIAFAAHTGWRRAEVCGLRWSDVELEGEQATVVCRRTVQKGDGPGNYHVLPTKTGRQRGTPIDGGLPALLLQHRASRGAALAEAGVLPGPGYVDDGYVFGVGDKPLDPERLRRGFAKLLKQAGITGVSFHGLRKATSSLAQAADVPLVDAAALLGHANMATTSKHYSEAYDPGLVEAAKKIGALLG